jgi:hypothetical protein
MKSMFISYRAPYPVTSGDKIRIFQNLEFLSEISQVDLVYLNENNNPSVVPLINNFYAFKKSRLKSIFDGIYYAIFKGWPLQIGYFYSKKLNDWVKLNFNLYDSIFLNNIRCYPYVENILNIKIFLDLVDSNLLNLENKIITSTLFYKLVYKLEYKLMKKYQKKVFNSRLNLFVISKRDKDHVLSDYPKAKISFYPNYVRNIELLESNFTHNIAFMGKLSYEPNIKAIRYFVNEIFPIIRIKYPNLNFNIIGSSFNKIYYRDILGFKGVNFIGFVDDLKSFVKNQRFFVAPMISGSGLQNKVIEAMGLGKIVIGTKMASEGLYPNIILSNFFFDNKSSLIDAIDYFLDYHNDHLVTENSKLVYNYIIANYSKKIVEKQFFDLLKAS